MKKKICTECKRPTVEQMVKKNRHDEKPWEIRLDLKKSDLKGGIGFFWILQDKKKFQQLCKSGYCEVHVNVINNK